jgi:hypothetical protein
MAKEVNFSAECAERGSAGSFVCVSTVSQNTSVREKQKRILTKLLQNPNRLS